MLCPYCNYPLPPKKGQRVLEHIASHILYDRKNVDLSTEPCGLCLRPYTVCQIHVKISNRRGKSSTPRIDWKRSTCTNQVAFQYKNAMESTGSSPCSNVPLRCPLCPTAAPAVWRYNLCAHFKRAHPAANIEEPALKKTYRLKDFEQSALKVIYENHRKVPKQRAKKVATLSISEAHSSHMAFR
ncbi:hypothetical protein K525DRAFT_208163 [Schizophyllum commune Loenen D]|nr:hypothetical protein K525DRAFT_208163 [Schizophyllum commune Loenen D]